MHLRKHDAEQPVWTRFDKVPSATLGTEPNEGENEMSSITSSYDRTTPEPSKATRESNRAREAANNTPNGSQNDAIKASTEDGLDQGTRPAPPDANLTNSPAGPLAALENTKKSRVLTTGVAKGTTSAAPKLKQPEEAFDGGKKSNPYGRLFFLDKPSTKGGMVMQRIKWSEQQPDGSWKPTKTYYEAFEVKPGEEMARPGDTFSARKGESVRIEAEATFYEGMTLNYLKSKGFAPFGVKKAGNLHAKAINTPDGRMTFDRCKGSNTMKDVWECRADHQGKCQ